MISLEQLITATRHNSHWSHYWSRYQRPLHLAVMIEPYCQLILSGQKTIESRFSHRQIAPYNQIQVGDVILIKPATTNSITGLCRARQIRFYNLDSDQLEQIRTNYATELGISQPEFWQQKRTCRYATLIWVVDVCPIQPIVVYKKDRRGWVVLNLTRTPGGTQPEPNLPHSRPQ